MNGDRVTVVIRTVGERTAEADVQIAENIWERNGKAVKDIAPF